jgi:ribosomal protein S18 acetylase RimI-like enzyme
VEGARPARREDAERCAELCRRALDELQQQRGGSLFARRETGAVAKALLRPGGLAALTAMPRRHVLVGTIDGAVVGLAVGHVDDVGEANLGVVDGCYVEPEACGVGLGRALLDALAGLFASSACRGIDAGALPGDRRTKNFFEAAGFKARLLTLHRPIE